MPGVEGVSDCTSMAVFSGYPVLSDGAHFEALGCQLRNPSGTVGAQVPSTGTRTLPLRITIADSTVDSVTALRIQGSTNAALEAAQPPVLVSITRTTFTQGFLTIAGAFSNDSRIDVRGNRFHVQDAVSPTFSSGVIILYSPSLANLFTLHRNATARFEENNVTIVYYSNSYAGVGFNAMSMVIGGGGAGYSLSRNLFSLTCTTTLSCWALHTSNFDNGMALMRAGSNSFIRVEDNVLVASVWNGRSFGPHWQQLDLLPNTANVVVSYSRNTITWAATTDGPLAISMMALNMTNARNVTYVISDNRVTFLSVVVRDAPALVFMRRTDGCCQGDMIVRYPSASMVPLAERFRLLIQRNIVKVVSAVDVLAVGLEQNIGTNTLDGFVEISDNIITRAAGMALQLVRLTNFQSDAAAGVGGIITVRNNTIAGGAPRGTLLHAVGAVTVGGSTSLASPFAPRPFYVCRNILLQTGGSSPVLDSQVLAISTWATGGSAPWTSLRACLTATVSATHTTAAVATVSGSTTATYTQSASTTGSATHTNIATPTASTAVTDTASAEGDSPTTTASRNLRPSATATKHSATATLTRTPTTTELTTHTRTHSASGTANPATSLSAPPRSLTPSSSRSPSRTASAPTAAQPRLPPLPLPVVAQAAQTVAGVVGCLGVVSTVAAVISTSGAMQRIATCNLDDDEEELSPLVHPLRFAAGGGSEGQGRFLRGAVVGNALAIPAITAAVFGALLPAALLALVARMRRRSFSSLRGRLRKSGLLRTAATVDALEGPGLSICALIAVVLRLPSSGTGADGPDGPDVSLQWARGMLRELRIEMGWPSVVVLPVVALAEGTAMAATRLLVSASEGAEEAAAAVVVAVLGLGFVVSLIAWWVRALVLVVPSADIALQPATRVGALISRVLGPVLRGIRRLCVCRQRRHVHEEDDAPLFQLETEQSWLWVLLTPAFEFRAMEHTAKGISSANDRNSTPLLTVPALSTDDNSGGATTAATANATPRSDAVRRRADREGRYDHIIGGKALRGAELGMFLCSLGAGVVEGLPASSAAMCRGRVVAAIVLIIAQGLLGVTTMMPFENVAIGALSITSFVAAGATLMNVVGVGHIDRGLLQRTATAVGALGLVAIAVALVRPVVTARRMLRAARARIDKEVADAFDSLSAAPLPPLPPLLPSTSPSHYDATDGPSPQPPPPPAVAQPSRASLDNDDVAQRGLSNDFSLLSLSLSDSADDDVGVPPPPPPPPPASPCYHQRSRANSCRLPPLPADASDPDDDGWGSATTRRILAALEAGDEEKRRRRGDRDHGPGGAPPEIDLIDVSDRLDYYTRIARGGTTTTTTKESHRAAL